MIVDEGLAERQPLGGDRARIAERVFYDLDAPVARVCAAEVPIPYPKHLEDAALPQAAGDRRRGACSGWRAPMV